MAFLCLPTRPKGEMTRMADFPNVVVITGASAGVGRAAVRAFGERGANVGLIARGRDDLEAANREAERLGLRGLFCITDVSDHAQVEAAAEASKRNLVRLTFGRTTR